MVTGGLAAVVYGHPRLTLDVDLVIRLAPHDAGPFVALWPANEFYCPPLEVIDEERGRALHGHFNMIHKDSAMRADVYLAGADAFSAWALQHRKARAVEGAVVRGSGVTWCGEVGRDA